ncbi:MAG: hypothetical protein ISR62_03850 [Desulfobacteraceae bacterium]|nr:hypothetical protein [Desulfobacterales bacterium]MBL6967537.1 hypothetical protein [Desulfobacteraceae bacterium]
MPYYKFEEFKRACDEDKNSVFPMGDVLKDAEEFFNLRTKTELLDFISNNGLENLQFVNTKDWENNPDKSNSIKVYAYEFRSMFKLGYIAFMYIPQTKNWIVKSFHLSKNMNPTMMIALQKAGLLTSGER